MILCSIIYALAMPKTVAENQTYQGPDAKENKIDNLLPVAVHKP